VSEENTPARGKADDEREREGERWKAASDFFAELTDDELVGRGNMRMQREPEMGLEMSRRVIVSNRELREAIDGFRGATEKSSKRLERLTWGLVAFTVILIVLTVILIVHAAG
jgi:hypothetical protein